MLRLRRRIAIAGVLAAAAFGLVAQPAAAIHQHAVLDCGTAGTYPIRVGETGAGLFPPSFVQVDLLTTDGQPAGTLIPFAISINGVWLQFEGLGDPYDALSGSLDLSTCSFTGSNGDYVVLIGILNIP
jgi:hypothetical protein